jgi:futalosine hydrolase
MNRLIVAATEGEIGPFLASHNARHGGIDILITGVGMVTTAYALTKQLQSQTYDLAVQVGVGGAFDRNIPLGSLVFVTTDQYADLGAEDHDNYLDLFEMGLARKDDFPFAGGRLINPLPVKKPQIALPHVSGLTVNMVSGNDRTIKYRTEKCHAQVESMEGAAFHEVCLREDQPFAQVRAISNYVTPRDKSQWKMKEAIINLNNWLIAFVNASMQ